MDFKKMIDKFHKEYKKYKHDMTIHEFFETNKTRTSIRDWFAARKTAELLEISYYARENNDKPLFTYNSSFMIPAIISRINNK